MCCARNCMHLGLWGEPRNNFRNSGGRQEIARTSEKQDRFIYSCECASSIVLRECAHDAMVGIEVEPRKFACHCLENSSVDTRIH